MLEEGEHEPRPVSEHVQKITRNCEKFFAWDDAWIPDEGEETRVRCSQFLVDNFIRKKSREGRLFRRGWTLDGSLSGAGNSPYVENHRGVEKNALW